MTNQESTKTTVCGELSHESITILGQMLEVLNVREQVLVGMCVEAAVAHWRAHGRLTLPLRVER